MHSITITVTFLGGLGFLGFSIFRNGHEVRKVAMNESGEETLKLEDGLYLFSGTGVSPDGGTEVVFSATTIPQTPCLIEPGPIFKSFSLHLS